MVIENTVEPFIDQFKISQQTGQDRYKTYYSAQDVELSRRVVIGVLRDSFASDPAFSQRYARRANTLAQVRHANLLRILHTGRTAVAAPYIATEPVEGYPLTERLARLKQQQATAHVTYALTLVRQVADGLALAEKLGLFHYALTPDHIILKNITLKSDDSVLVTDLDIPDDENALQLAEEAEFAALYLAPEQSDGRPPDGASHVYSMGVVLYELLSGQPHVPLRGLGRRLTGWFRGVSSLEQRRPDLTVETYSLVQRALQKSPRRRFGTIAEFLEALDAALEAEELRIHTGQYVAPRQARPLFLIPVFLLLLCISLAVAAQQVIPLVPTPTSIAIADDLVVGAMAGLEAKTPTVQSSPAPEVTLPPRSAVSEAATVVPAAVATSTSTPSATSSPTSLPTSTPIPPTEVAVSAETVPAPLSTFRVDVSSANLRLGPGTNYEVDGYVLQGETVLVLARNVGTFLWYNVETADGRRGWVAADVGSPTGPDGLAGVEIAATIPVPPTPTPTPTPTNTPTPTATVLPLAPGQAGGGNSGGNGPGTGGGDNPTPRPTLTPPI